MTEENKNETTTNTQTGPVVLSKAFQAKNIHTTSYSGGKVVILSSDEEEEQKDGDVIASSSDSTEMVDINDDDKDSVSTKQSLIYAQCFGDVCVIDGKTGVTLRKIRKGLQSESTLTKSWAEQKNKTIDEDDDGYYDSDEEDDMIDLDSILNFSVSPCQKIIATLSRNNLLRVYRNNISLQKSKNTSVQLIQTISRAHDSPVKAMEFHWSGAYMVTGAVDGIVKVWDMRNAFSEKRDAGDIFITHVYRMGCDIVGGVSTLAWAPHSPFKKQQEDEDDNDESGGGGGVTLGIGFENGRVDLVDLMKYTSAKKSKNSSNSAMIDIASSTENKTTISGGIHVVGGVEAHVSSVTGLVWSGGNVRNGHNGLFITAGRDEVINIWDIQVEKLLDEQEEQGKKKGNKKRKKNLTFANTSSQEVQYRTTYTRMYAHPIYEHIESIQVLSSSISLKSANSTHVITVGNKGIMRIWNVETSRSDNKLKCTLDCIYNQSANENPFGEDRGGYTHLLLNNQKKKDLDDHSEETTTVENQLIAVDAHHNLTYFSFEQLLEKKGKKKQQLYKLKEKNTIVGHNDEIIDMKVLPSPTSSEATQSRIAVVTNSSLVKIFELPNFICASTLSQHSDIVLCMDVSPCGNWIVTAGKDRSMILWSTKDTYQPVAIANGHTEAIGATALSRKMNRYGVDGGAFAVTASKDRTLKKWSLPSSDQLQKHDSEQLLQLKASASVLAHEKDINIVTMAPNDSLVATGSQDKTVKLWSTTDLSLQRTLVGHKRGVWDCQFSPIDRVIATASGDKLIKLWNINDGKCVRTFQGHIESVLRVRFLSGGLQLASCGGDGLIKVWTIRSNECETTLDGHTEKIWALDIKAAVPENNEPATIVSGGADSRLVVWKDTTQVQEDEKMRKREELLLMEQKLSNHLRYNEFEQALELALKLEKPHMAFKVLSSLIENALEKQSKTPTLSKDVPVIESLCKHVRSWSLSRRSQVLKYCRDWNTRARTSFVAMATVRAIVRCVPITSLAFDKKENDEDKEKYYNIPEICAGIVPYAERHLERLDDLYSSSYMIDFVLFSMGKGVTSEDESKNENLLKWEQGSKFVLPAPQPHNKGHFMKDIHMEDDEEDEDIITVGDSDSDSDHFED